MNVFVTSASEVMLSAMSVCLFVCLFVWLVCHCWLFVFLSHEKTTEHILTKFGSGPRIEPG